MKLNELKEKGLAPEFLTEEALNTLRNGYLLENETPKEAYERCAAFSAKVYKNSEDFKSDFFQAIWNNWLCPATPVLSNAATENLQISCYSGIPSNKVAGIMDHMKEMAILTKRAGGVGSSFDLLRPDSGDIVPFAKILEATIEGITQGKQRRGSVASYLNIKHPNAEEFINIRNPIGDLSRKCQSVAFHNAITIDDEVMTEITTSKGKYRDMWKSIMTNRAETGEPYILFQDNANKQCPEEYRGIITQSNLCLHPLTKVVTREFGDVYIKDLAGRSATIFNGKTWELNSNFRVTQNNATFKAVAFNSGSEIVLCTENHRWPVKGKGLIPTTELEPGDKIPKGGIDSRLEHVVIDVSDSGITDDAYCTTVPSTGMFLLTGNILTGNCSEIMAPVTPQETFVCCLSSLNLYKYDEWKDYKFPKTGLTLVELSIHFLDAVITNFIKQTENMDGLQNARRFAIRHRMLGLGVLGWHSLLQSKDLAFESFQAMQLNNEIFSKLRKESYAASEALGKELGYCEVAPSRRNSALLAVAPTMSNSLLSGGVSQGIEPLTANIFSQKSAKGVFIKRNPVLIKYLQDNKIDTPEVWEQINKDRGSVKNVKQLSDEVKRVFLTAREINQFALINQASQRQKYIDQGQSLNLFFNLPNKTDEKKAVAKYINDVHIEAWKSGIKSLYYLKTDSPLKGDVIAVDKDGECMSCQG